MISWSFLKVLLAISDQSLCLFLTTKEIWTVCTLLRNAWDYSLKFTDSIKTKQAVNSPSLFVHFSPFEYEYTMKRRAEDQEPIFASQQQQSSRSSVQGIAEGFQHRALAPAPTVIEAAADNMQPSTGIQYSLPQGYQVWGKKLVFIQVLRLIFSRLWMILNCH